MNASDVTLVVPVGGAAPAWQRSADSLKGLDPPPGEIIVVVDGPNEAHEAIAEEIGARILTLPEQGGPARARNRGAALAQSEVLIFVDSDIEVPPRLIAQVAEIFTDTSDPAAAIGSYDDAPGDPGFLSQYRNLLHHYVHQTGRDEASTFWSGCGAVRRQAFEAVGGFDESYVKPSIEDIELGARLIQAGHSIRLVKDLQVKHLKIWRPINMLSTDLWGRAVPWTRLMLSNGHLVNDLNVKTNDRISVVLAFLALGSLPLALISWLFLGASVLALILMIGLNASTFGFYRRKCGILFAAGVVPWYWIYLIICGLGFVLGIIQYLLDKGVARVRG